MNAGPASDSDGGPFDPTPDGPITVVVPRQRRGIFAAIHVDAREATLRIWRLAPDGSFQNLHKEGEVFNVPGPQVPADPGKSQIGGDPGKSPTGGVPGKSPTEGDPRSIAIKLADILIRFQRTAELFGAAIRAVATQPFRALPNHEELLRRLRRVTRVALELISERETARFLCLGALRGQPRDQRSLLIDVAEDDTMIIWASTEEPLGIWRLGFGSSRLLAPSNPANKEPDGVRVAMWRRQVQQTLSRAQLEATRRGAREIVLIRRSEGAGAPHLAAVAVLAEIASHLNILNIQSSQSGLHEGILLDLSRTLGSTFADLRTDSPQPTPRPRSG